MGTTIEASSSTLPDWLKPYLPDLLTSASQIGTQPYQPYGGQRIAGFNPMQTKAFTGIGGLGPSSYLSNAANLATQGATNQFTGANVGQFMSPYMQNVVDQQKTAAIQDYSRQIPGLQAQGIRAGARGGTREALLQSEAQRNLNQQLQGIQATGLQNAFQNAQNQFNQQQQNLFTGAGALAGLGGQEFGQKLQALQTQAGAGSQMQNLEQQRLDQMYQDFLAQREYPQKQASFMADILRGGSPSAASLPTTTTTSTPSPSIIPSIAGIIGLYMANKYGGG